MEYLVTVHTDIGLKKSTNQDSAAIRVANSDHGKVTLAIVCDGMGGLERGEMASAAVVRAFTQWFEQSLPKLLYEGNLENDIRQHWDEIIKTENYRIQEYGMTQGVQLGTTVTVMLLTQERYYVMNVGDTRAYEITDDQLRQITRDQTVIAREIELGTMTIQQARQDPRRNMLLQCVGASAKIDPDFYVGIVQRDAVYMICSDGFWHELTEDELYSHLNRNILIDETTMLERSRYLIELSKSRQEVDNITIVLVRTY